MTRYDFLWARWVILSNVRTDLNLTQFAFLLNFSCELGANNDHIWFSMRQDMYSDYKYSDMKYDYEVWYKYGPILRRPPILPGDRALMRQNEMDDDDDTWSFFIAQNALLKRQGWWCFSPLLWALVLKDQMGPILTFVVNLEIKSCTELWVHTYTHIASKHNSCTWTF